MDAAIMLTCVMVFVAVAPLLMVAGRLVSRRALRKIRAQAEGETLPDRLAEPRAAKHERDREEWMAEYVRLYREAAPGVETFEEIVSRRAARTWWTLHPDGSLEEKVIRTPLGPDVPITHPGDGTYLSEDVDDLLHLRVSPLRHYGFHP